MHGVGRKFAEKSFATFGLPPFIPVEEQKDPNPDFPTVAFPNPEEGKGALVRFFTDFIIFFPFFALFPYILISFQKLSIETADKHCKNHSCIIVANDPDADRMAAAERSKNGSCPSKIILHVTLY